MTEHTVARTAVPAAVPAADAAAELHADILARLADLDEQVAATDPLPALATAHLAACDQIGAAVARMARGLDRMHAAVESAGLDPAAGPPATESSR